MAHPLAADRRVQLAATISPSSRFAAVFAGGFAGTLARAGLGEALPYPWATLLVNLAGAALLGYVVVALPHRRPLLGTGLCGALTTFSTLQLEALEMLDDAQVARAAGYLALTAVGGWLAVGAGRRLAR